MLFPVHNEPATFLLKSSENSSKIKLSFKRGKNPTAVYTHKTVLNFLFFYVCVMVQGVQELAAKADRLSLIPRTDMKRETVSRKLFSALQ